MPRNPRGSTTITVDGSGGGVGDSSGGDESDDVRYTPAASSSEQLLRKQEDVGPACGFSASNNNLDRLRTRTKDGMVNLGVLGAFMSALAGQSYTNTPDNPKCFGEVAVHVMVTMQWFSMGFFFFCVLVTMIIILDIDGVPDSLLVQHLRHTRTAHTIANAACMLGVITMALGYGIDLGERRGCGYALVGYIAAPSFAVAVFIMQLWLRAKRRQLNQFMPCSVTNADGEAVEYNLQLGCAWFTTWNDLLSDFEKDD